MALERTQPESAKCSKCGYSLAGLGDGARCPECGTPSIKRVSVRFIDNLSDAPMWYLKRLRRGFLTMTLAMVSAAAMLGFSGYYLYFKAGTLLSINGIEHYFAAGYLLCGLIWFAGAWLIATGRPVGPRTLHDASLDSPLLRNLAWKTQGILPLAVILLWGVQSIPAGAVSLFFLILGFLALALAAFSLVPVSLYMASIADWAGESSLAYKIRGAAWVIVVIGTLGAITFVGALLPMASAGIFQLFSFYALTVNLFAAAAIAVSVLLLARTTQWAIINNGNMAARNSRLSDKLSRNLERQGRGLSGGEDYDPNTCQECGVDLTNLGRSGQCPECHTVFVKEEQPWSPEDRYKGIPLVQGKKKAALENQAGKKISRILHISRGITKARVRYRPADEISRGLPRVQEGSEGMHEVKKPGPISIDKRLDDLPEEPSEPSQT